MQVALVLYKGNSNNLLYFLADTLIRIRLWSKYSHAELMINKKCYSSSARDGGVRGKYIDYLSDKWDVFYFDITEEEYQKVMLWYETNKDKAYDWTNIVRFVIPFMKERPDKFICFEAVAAMLGIPSAYDARPSTLIEYVKKRNSNESKQSTESK